MTNIEKYNNAFVEVFGVEIAVLNDGFSKDSVDAVSYTHLGGQDVAFIVVPLKNNYIPNFCNFLNSLGCK